MSDSLSYTRTLPAKRMAAGALIFNAEQHLLIVKPTYRDHWLIPGGAVEADESPRAACRREVSEELGLDLPVGDLLCLEYCSALPDRTESLQFVFAGGTLREDQIRRIRLPAAELSAYAFCPPEEALALLNGRLSRRVRAALAGTTRRRLVYLEDGVADA
jgi:8-oxo-dGTP diphosphatase